MGRKYSGSVFFRNKQVYDFPDSREADIQKALYECIEKIKNESNKNGC